MEKHSLRQPLFRTTLTVGLILLFSLQFAAQQKLMLVGGGKRPPEATMKFVQWAGGEKAKILVITWASGEPAESFIGAKGDFEVFKPGEVENAPTAPLDATKREQFLKQLSTATGVFFSGGDQNRVMEVLKDEQLLNALKGKYLGGTPFGGTSAGEAIMSDPMMTGDADLTVLDGTKVGVRKGLGLLPGVILDQHFLKRQRHNRLFGLIMEHRDMLGIGIDEDTALMVENNRIAKVFGPSRVMFVDARQKLGGMMVYFLEHLEVFDLKKRKPVVQVEFAAAKAQVKR
jgi:cyanophycinase